MVPIYPNLFTTTPSSLGFMYDEPQVSNWHQNQELTTIVDHHFNLTTFGHDNHWLHQPQPQPSNDIDLYNYCNGQLNNINYTTTVLPPAMEQIWPVEAVMASTEEAEKKRRLDHNASERGRRKKINSMYSSLRNVLPIINQKKKLSNPATVMWALKYIPDLQKKVQVLFERKHEIVSSKSTNKVASTGARNSSYSVQATNLGKGEVVVQISSPKSANNMLISRIIRELEEENGVVVMEMSSSESPPAGRVFHHLHLMVEASCEVDCEVLREKLLCLCQKFTAPAASMDQLNP